MLALSGGNGSMDSEGSNDGSAALSNNNAATTAHHQPMIEEGVTVVLVPQPISEVPENFAGSTSSSQLHKMAH